MHPAMIKAHDAIWFAIYMVLMFGLVILPSIGATWVLMQIAGLIFGV